MSDISSLKGKITRFAPSITGYLHLGHLYHLLLLEKLFVEAGVKVLVRLEDHDTLRSRKEYENVILDLLDWFGFEFFKESPQFVRQSDRNVIYEEYLDKFSNDNIFKCDCTRSRLKNLKLNKWHEFHYDGKCFINPLFNPQKFGWRVRFKDQVTTGFEYPSLEINQNPYQQVHSSILKNHVGQWSYQFSVVVDDIAQGVDLVVRGKDVMHTTGRYLQIANMLGVDYQPIFLHHDLIYDSDMQKLSKRFGSEAIHQWKNDGLSKEQVVARLKKTIDPKFKDDALDVKSFIASIKI